jgi:membrane protease YdiL (CAAX protease family)
VTAQLEPIDMRQRTSRLPALALLCAFYWVWTFWAILLIHQPMLDRWPIRLTARLIIWGGMALLYAAIYPDWSPRIRFTCRALILGLNASSFCIGGLIWQCMQKHSYPTMPIVGDIANAIIAGPVLEEIVFRAIIFRELSTKTSFIAAAPVSAALFAMIHLPYWWLAHTMPMLEMLLSLGGIFLLGVVLALIYRMSGSLIAPIILHVLNNLTSLA